MSEGPCGCVYFVQAKKLRKIKIGSTTDVDGRLADLQASSPDRLILLGLVPCSSGSRAHAREMRLHHQFRAHHLWGEWFRSSREILAFVGALGQRPVEIPLPENWSVKAPRPRLPRAPLAVLCGCLVAPTDPPTQLSLAERGL